MIEHLVDFNVPSTVQGYLRRSVKGWIAGCMSKMHGWVVGGMCGGKDETMSYPQLPSEKWCECKDETMFYPQLPSEKWMCV